MSEHGGGEANAKPTNSRATPPTVPPRLSLAIAVSVVSLTFAVAVVIVGFRAPDKGFLAFTGHKVVDVRANGPAERAGIRVGDVIAAIDGKPVLSTMDYINRLNRRAVGDEVELTLKRAGSDQPTVVTVKLGSSPTPWPAIAATLLAVILLALGLIALYGRPYDSAARRFWRVSVVFAIVFAGALSWPQLLVHPTLFAVFCIALFMAAPISADFSLAFPTSVGASARFWRATVYVPAVAMLVGVSIAGFFAVRDFQAGLATDRGLQWVVRFIVGLLMLTLITSLGGIVAQYRRTRTASPAERNQAKWLLFGFTLAFLPGFVSIPIAAANVERFLLVGYRPFVITIAILLFASHSLAVLRIRLADVDAVIKRSMVYAVASGGAAVIYLLMVLAVSLLAERMLGQGSVIPHVVAAVAAAATFGPLGKRVTRWLDRRFFRDRLHYVRALRDLAEASARLREPPELARQVVEGSVDALRAEGGALYLAADPSADVDPDDELALVLVQAVGDDHDQTLSLREAERAPIDGLSVAIGEHGRRQGFLLLGPRLDGQMYSSEDRDLVGALSGQLAISFDNARAFGTIAEMTRTLEQQNDEIRELRDKVEDENRYLKARLEAAGEDARIVGSSKVIRALTKQIERVAASEASVLIGGESGTGKGLIARTIHAASNRADKPFIQVDCGAIPHGVFESELFGHERGAFTGAVRKRRGHFELADNGTLFLDEIGELPLDLQPKLLRAIQEKSFLRVGGSKPATLDVRIIAATNRDLEDMIKRGTFREDLYYRLRVVELTAPALRQRKSDIAELVDHMLPRLCRRNNRPVLSVAAPAMERLKRYTWPGNVRELENVLERAAVLCDTQVISEPDLALPEGIPQVEQLVAGLALPEDASHEQVMEAIEIKRLEAALRAADGNQSGAARSLGMARTTFINKLRRFKLI